MTPLNTVKIQEEASKILDMDPDSIDIEFDGPCTGDGWHSTACQLMMERQWKPCIREQISAARHHQKRLSMLDQLTNCARNPLAANGMRVLEGMATDGCVYEVE